jgi:glutamate dehydrogenase
MNAFPAPMRARHAKAIETHRLRGEIIATKLANRIVNRLGLILPFELAEEEGVALGDVAEAFVIVEQVHELPALWSAIDSADISEDARLMLFEQVAIEVRAHMADVLRNAVKDRANDKAVAAYAPAIRILDAQRDSLLPAEARAQMEAYAARLMAAGAPRRLVEPVVRLVALDGAIGIAAHASRMKVDVVDLTRAFVSVGTLLGLDWAQGTAMQLDPRDPWERLLSSSLARDFQAMRLDFLSRIGGRNPARGVADWQAANAERVATFRAGLDRARRGGMPTTAMLAQIAGQARVLLAR